MARVITIGETMAALTPGSSGALRYVTDYRIRIAGAESNVAVGLSKLGIETAWISRVGEDELGYFVRNQIRSEGVDCREVIFDPEHRTGAKGNRSIGNKGVLLPGKQRGLPPEPKGFKRGNAPTSGTAVFNRDYAGVERKL